jgi:siroheme synthase-like protein
VSGIPVVLRAERLSALVVGGGTVAARRAGALAEGGARVRIVAPEVCDELVQLAERERSVTIARRPYATGDLGDATLVIAATDDRAVNARVAGDALAAQRLVNVADAPEEGNCIVAAAHRAGDLVIGVAAGGVPGAAARVRDAIAARFDGRYADAVGRLGELRRRLLGAGGRDEWRRAAGELVSADFCDAVERGELAGRVSGWR